MDAAHTHLVLFLSRATSLERWNASGILVRELTYYHELRTSLGEIRLVTPGGKTDQQYYRQFEKTTLLYNRWNLPPNLYSLCAPFLHWSVLRSADIFKSNQLDGAWTALIAGRLFNKPVIVRVGYLWSDFVRRDQGEKWKTRIIKALERFSLNEATAIFVSSGQIQDQLVTDSRIKKEKIRVIPNYVDTELFRPIKSRQVMNGRICFIGRLHPQKNLARLILAVSEIPGCSLVVVGEGKQRMELENLARKTHAAVEFTGILNHSELPALINSCQLFVLPSLYEGHPKALIEAMACGVPVIGSDVPGIKEIINHGQNGLVCSPEHENLRTAIQGLLNDLKLQDQLGQNARKYVVEHFSLPRIIDLELSAIRSIVDRDE